MGFKLIRTDTEEPCKIQLPVGNHIIGRGKFLDCDDKRISRYHGELQVSDDTIIIKALHQNPCFYIKKGSNETQILKQDCSVNLGNEDKFGLLPSSHWYEVLHCTLAETPISTVTKENEQDRLFEDTESVEMANLVADVESDLHNVDTNETVFKNDSESPILSNVNAPGSPGSPSLLAPYQDSAKPVQESSSSPKRCHSPQNDVKRIKTEPDVKTEPTDAQPGPSGDAGTSNNDDVKVPVSPDKPQGQVGRERCFYGEKCYRRNPAHKAQFSHPGDTDWGSGSCPHGRACVRRDPRHWTTHTHPPGTLPPANNVPGPGARKKPRKQKVEQVNDDQDSPVVDINLIVNGKRTRKTIKRDHYSDSESENEDPFQTDGSEDEWEPKSDIETQETQDFYTQDF